LFAARSFDGSGFAMQCRLTGIARAFSGKVGTGLPFENALLNKDARILITKPVPTFVEYAHG